MVESDSGTHLRPLPHWDTALWRPHFEALREGKLLVQQCLRCQAHQWPPRELCSRCQAAEIAWREAARIGRIYTYTVIFRAFEPFFDSRVPYGVVSADLADPVGLRFLAPYFGDDASDLACEMPVALEFEVVSDEITLPYWVRR